MTAGTAGTRPGLSRCCPPRRACYRTPPRRSLSSGPSVTRTAASSAPAVAALGITSRAIERGGRPEAIAAAARGYWDIEALHHPRRHLARRRAAAARRIVGPGHDCHPRYRRRRLVVLRRGVRAHQPGRRRQRRRQLLGPTCRRAPDRAAAPRCLRGRLLAAGCVRLPTRQRIHRWRAASCGASDSGSHRKQRNAEGRRGGPHSVTGWPPH